MDDGAQGGQFAAELGDDVAAVVVLAAVAVAVDGEQDDGFDLLEAVEDAAGAEVGGAGGPDAADGGGGEEGDDGLRDVRQVAADAVAGAHAEARSSAASEPTWRRSSAQVHWVAAREFGRVPGRRGERVAAARRACSA